MKILAILGTFVGVLAIAAALYLQFAVVEAAAIAESISSETPDASWSGSAERKAVMDAMNWKTDLGIMVMFAGLAAVLMSIVPAIKKQKLAWLGVLTGLAAGLIGAMHGTHMFS